LFSGGSQQFGWESIVFFNSFLSRHGILLIYLDFTKEKDQRKSAKSVLSVFNFLMER